MIARLACRSSLLVVALFVGSSPALAQVAAPAPGAPAGGSPAFAGNPMGQLLGYLFQPQIQRELSLVDEQKEDIEKIRNEMNSKLQEAYKNLQNVDPAERQRKYYEVYAKVGGEIDKRVEEVLLPHQLKRIRQISLQMRLATSGYGSAAALQTSDVVESLGLSPTQIEELQKREAEVRKEIQEKTREFYKKLNDEAREKILGVLTSAQREKLRELEGERYEFKPYTPPAGNPASKK